MPFAITLPADLKIPELISYLLPGRLWLLGEKIIELAKGISQPGHAPTMQPHLSSPLAHIRYRLQKSL